MTEDIGMERFRPNFILSEKNSNKPYKEDYFGKIKIGNCEFEGITLCSRC